MQEALACYAGICCGYVLAGVGFAAAGAVLLSTRHLRTVILPAFFKKGNALKAILFLAVIAPAMLLVIGGTVLLEFAAMIPTILLEWATGFPALYLDLAMAGPVEEPMKLVASAIFLASLAFLSSPRKMQVRDAMACGALSGIFFGGIEAFLYLGQGVAGLLSTPSFYYLDAVLWRVAFGALLHGLMSSFAASMLGARGWNKLWTVATLAVSIVFHALINLASTISMDESAGIGLALLTDAVQASMIFVFYAITATLWLIAGRVQSSTAGGEG